MAGFDGDRFGAVGSPRAASGVVSVGIRARDVSVVPCWWVEALVSREVRCGAGRTR